MKVKELMTRHPACCQPETSLTDVARLMVDNDCGSIPVVDQNEKIIGVVTDRDIVTRAVAEGKNPAQLRAEDCMTSRVVTISPEESIEECCQKMEEHQVRRIPVTDDAGKCCGIVSQADIALEGDEAETAEVVKLVSQPVGSGF